MILIGTDFSPTAQAATAYAATLADHRRVPLHLVHAAHPAVDEQARADIDIGLKLAAEDVRHTHPGLTEVSARMAEGYPAPVLAAASRTAAVTVVGCRGAGGFAGLSLGSVAQAVAERARGPVIVFRPLDRPMPTGPVLAGPMPTGPMPTGPVLAGLCGLPSGLAALDFAAEEAHRRRCDLIITHVYRDGAARQAADLTGFAADHCRLNHPELDIVEWHIMSEHPRQAMVEASRDIALTVVAARGPGGAAAPLLGSVARTLIRHAHSPVAVIHPK